MSEATPERPEVVEDSVEVESAVQGDTPLAPDVLGGPAAGPDPDTPEFVEPVPPDGT